MSLSHLKVDLRIQNNVSAGKAGLKVAGNRAHDKEKEEKEEEEEVEEPEEGGEP